MSPSNDRELQLLRKHFLSLVSQPDPLLTTPISDLFLVADCAEGALLLFGDDDQEICRIPVYSWEGTGTAESPSAAAIETLREVITRLEQKGFWAQDAFSRPFSIELVRPDFSVIEELLFLDEELIRLDTPLLEGLDEELEAFLSDLLEDTK